MNFERNYLGKKAIEFFSQWWNDRTKRWIKKIEYIRLPESEKIKSQIVVLERLWYSAGVILHKRGRHFNRV